MVEVVEREIRVNKRFIIKVQILTSDSGRNTGQVQQPIFVHTGPAGYHRPQDLQSWSPVVIQSPESRPMLPQPSAPPRPHDNFHIEHPPPPYEKLYTGKH